MRLYPVRTMSRQYKIGELARAAEVPTSTVRHYERIGLLKPAGRTPHNYRYYSDEAVERLRFIRAAQTSGFTLDNIEALLELRGDAHAPNERVQGLIRQRLGEVEGRLRDLRHVRDVLRSSLKTCQRGEGDGVCDVLDSLNSST